MTKFLIGAAALAIVSASPASAQLVGSGIGGNLGGSLGGPIGGLSGSARGGLDTTIDAGRAATRAADRARDATRRAERAARKAERRRERAGLTGSAAVDGMVSRDDRGVDLGGSAGGSIGLDRPALPTRGIAAASARGLRRVSQTATGVPVFVRAGAIAAPTIVAAPVVTAYPVYGRNAYYGGGYYGGSNTVFIESGQVGPYMDRQYRDLSRDMAGTGATVTRRGRDLIVALPADVTFAFDKSDIQPRFYGTLNALARSLDAYRATDVEILGHTDAVGSDSYNLGLSERRGRSVADFLVNRAADPSRLVVEAMGESEPVATNATVQGRAANRRVEIVLHPRGED